MVQPFFTGLPDAVYLVAGFFHGVGEASSKMTVLLLNDLVAFQDIDHSLEIARLVFVYCRLTTHNTFLRTILLLLCMSIGQYGRAWILCDFLDVGEVIVKDEEDEFEIADIDEDIRLYEFEAATNYLQSYHELLRKVGEHPMGYLFIAVVPNQKSHRHQLPEHLQKDLIDHRIELYGFLEVGNLLRVQHIHELPQKLPILMVTKIFILQLAQPELPIASQHFPHKCAVIDLLILQLKGQLHEIEIKGSDDCILPVELLDLPVLRSQVGGEEGGQLQCVVVEGSGFLGRQFKLLQGGNALED